MSKSDDFLGSQGRILDILEYIISKKDFVSIDEISQLFKLSKSGTFRILNILVKKDFLYYSKDKKGYFISEKFIDHSMKLLSTNPILLISKKVIQKLKNKVNDNIIFTELEGDRIKVLKEISSLNESFSFEEKYPIYATSFGKILLSYTRKDNREKILKKIILKRYTKNTIIDKKILLDEIQRIKKEKISTSFEEYKIGYCDISIPIIDRKNKKVYSLGIILSKYKFTKNYENLIIKELKIAKYKIEESLNKFYKIFA